jgi:hypothetical protein
MDVCIDESEPEDSIQRYFSEVKSTGEEALSVPPHWHKVHRPLYTGMEREHTY